MIPEVVELDEAAADRLCGRSDEFKELGLVIERFGPVAVVVREVPALLGDDDVGVLVRDLTDDLAEYGDGLRLRDRASSDRHRRDPCAPAARKKNTAPRRPDQPTLSLTAANPATILSGQKPTRPDGIFWYSTPHSCLSATKAVRSFFALTRERQRSCTLSRPVALIARANHPPMRAEGALCRR